MTQPENSKLKLPTNKELVRSHISLFFPRHFFSRKIENQC